MPKDFNNTFFLLLVQDIDFLNQLTVDLCTGINFNICIKKISLSPFLMLHISLARERNQKLPWCLFWLGIQTFILIQRDVMWERERENYFILHNYGSLSLNITKYILRLSYYFWGPCDSYTPIQRSQPPHDLSITILVILSNIYKKSRTQCNHVQYTLELKTMVYLHSNCD